MIVSLCIGICRSALKCFVAGQMVGFKHGSNWSEVFRAENVTSLSSDVYQQRVETSRESKPVVTVPKRSHGLWYQSRLWSVGC